MKPVLTLKRYARRIRYFGTAAYCPVCNSRLSRFLPSRGRLNSRCPVCQSSERHRLIVLYLKERTDFFSGLKRRMLHVAPELWLSGIFRDAPGINYLSVDLDPRKAMQREDLTALSFADNTFDIIYCSHVLEHIPDDKKAMHELCRVLKPGGWAILQVPLLAETTLEDAAINTPELRLQNYGHPGHVRIYGKDYKDRLESAGFKVTVDDFAKRCGEDEARRIGFYPQEDIYFCRKR